MLLVITTFPDAPTARLIGTALVEEKLAACVNLLPKIESFFFWNGQKETSNEVIGLLKTSPSAYPRLEARLNELHPYDVPEIIALPISRGLEAYVNWVEESTKGDTPARESGPWRRDVRAGGVDADPTEG